MIIFVDVCIVSKLLTKLVVCRMLLIFRLGLTVSSDKNRITAWSGELNLNVLT